MEVIGESKNEIDLLKGVVDALYDTSYHIVILGIIDEGILRKMERRSPFFPARKGRFSGYLRERYIEYIASQQQEVLAKVR